MDHEKTLSAIAAEQEKEYRKAPGLNYSFLSQFHESQDHALLKMAPKSFFETGHIFEDMVRDACKGTTFFDERYFATDAKGKIPDNLMQWIETGHDLESEIVYKGDGTRNNTHKAKHAYIDACLENPGKYPISQYDRGMLCIMLHNFLDMELMGGRVGDILRDADFQVPIYWEKNGIKKKALLDAVAFVDGFTIPLDIKTAATRANFNQFLNKKYWIQKHHYMEGAEAEYGNVHSFTFLAAFKEDPFLCEPVEVCGDTGFQYDELCRDCHNWLKNDKPQKGYLPERKHYVKIWN